MIEIFTKLACHKFCLDIASCRRDDTHIDLDLVGATYALKRLFDEHAQNLVLRLPRHVGDLVDEQRAAMGLFESTDLAPLTIGWLLDAEQLDLHAFGHHRGSIDDDERTIGSARLGMYGSCRQLLAGPGGTDNQDAAIGGCNFFDGLS